jgi:hypothetical protein
MLPKTLPDLIMLAIFPPFSIHFHTHTHKSISIKMDVCVYVCVCPGITLERLERFRPNLAHTLLYVCKNLMYILYIFRREDGVGGREFG